MGFYPAGAAAEHNEGSLYPSAEGREAPGRCQGWERCVFSQEELVLYILALHGEVQTEPSSADERPALPGRGAGWKGNAFLKAGANITAQ